VIKRLYIVLLTSLFQGHQVQLDHFRTKKKQRQKCTGADLLFKEFHFELSVSLNLLLRNKLHLKAIAFENTLLNFEITVIMQL